MALSLAELEKDYKKWEAGKAKQAEMANKSKQVPAKNRTVPVLESKAEKAQRVQQANDLQSLQTANDLMASQKSVPVQQDMSMPSTVNKLSGTMDMGLPTGVTKFGDSKPSNLNLNNKPSESLEPMKKGGATWTKEYDYENAWKPLDRTERQKLEREARNIQSKGTSASIEEMDRLREIYDIVDENDRKVAVNDKSNIDKYLSPNYRLSSQEESIAKEMIDNYFNENPNAKKLLQASSSNANRASKIKSQMTKKEQEEYAKMTALMNKTSNLSAFTYGMLNIMPFGNTAMDKMGELMGVDDAYNYSAQEKNIKTQSPLAYTGGDMASKLAAYSVLGGEIEKIPALAKATNKAGAFLSGGNKVAGDMIGNVLRGDLADIALDTIPTEIENYRNGMSGADIAKDTAKNLLANTAFNAVGEVVPYLWKSARGQLGNVAEEAADIPRMTNLEMEREALQSSQNDWDALRAEMNRKPTNLEMEQAANVDNMDVLRQAMAEQEAERVAREEAERVAREQAAREIPRVGEEPSLIAEEPAPQDYATNLRNTLENAEPIEKADMLVDAGYYEDMQEAGKAYQNGTLDADVEQYLSIMEKNGDPTPTKPIVEVNDYDMDALNEKYNGDWTAMRKGTIKEYTGASDEKVDQYYNELDKFFSGSGSSANVEILDDYVEHAPAYKGEMRRGMHFRLGDGEYDKFMAKVHEGSVVTLDKPSSWASDWQVARRFSHLRDPYYDSIEIVCNQNRTSTPVSFANFHGEDEILSSSKASWTLLKEDTAVLDNGSRKTILYVVETGDNTPPRNAITIPEEGSVPNESPSTANIENTGEIIPNNVPPRVGESPSLLAETPTPADADKIARYQRLLNDEDYLNSEAKRLAERDTAMGFAKDIDQAKMELEDLARRNLKNVDVNNVAKEVPAPNKVMAEDIGLNPNTVLEDEIDNIAKQADEIVDGNNALKPQEDYNIIEETEDPGRTIGSITETDNMRERGLAQHIRGDETPMKVKDVPDEVADDFRTNKDMYRQLKNSDTKARAEKIYNDPNIDTEAEFNKMLENKDPASLPLGCKIARDYSAAGDHEAASLIYRRMGEKLTEAGQFTQAAVIEMMKNDPLTALDYFERDLAKLNREGAEKYGKKWKDFILTDEEKGLFNNIEPGDKDAIKAAMDKIGARIEKEYPSTLWDKVLEFRRVAMLFNLRTIEKNFLANPATALMRYVADRIEGVGQWVAHLINPEFEITQAIRGSNVDTREIAKQMFESEKVQNMLKDIPGRLSEVPRVGDYAARKQVFKGGFVSDWINRLTNNGIVKLNQKLGKEDAKSLLELGRNSAYGALEVTDSPFVKENFISRLGSYCRAKGITNIEDIPDKALDIALEESLKATYKDNSWLVKGIRKAKGTIEEVGNGIAPRLGDIASQATIPYVQAPGNIGARIVDYSPLGAIKSIGKLIANHNDPKAVSKAIEELSKGLSGTSLAGLGMALYKSGIITGTESEDPDQRAFEKQNGFREFAIRYTNPFTGKINYETFNWMQPFADVIMTGVLLQQAIDASDKYDSDVLRYFGYEGTNVGKALGVATEAAKKEVNYFFDATPLSNFGDLFKSQGYSGETDIASNLWSNAVEDFASGMLPAQVKSIAKTVDPTQRQITDPSNSFATFVNGLKAGVPGLSKTLPVKYDNWGEPMTYGGSVAEAGWNKLLYPGEHVVDTSDDIDKELNRIFEGDPQNGIEGVGDSGIFPLNAPNTVDGVKLTAQQKSEYQHDMGMRSRDMVESFMSSSAYQSLNDKDRNEIIKKFYGTSKAITERDLFNKAISDKSTYKKAIEAYDNAGGGEKGAQAVADFFTNKNETKQITGNLSTSSNTYKDAQEKIEQGDIEGAKQVVADDEYIRNNFTKDTSKGVVTSMYKSAKNYDSSITPQEYVSTFKTIDSYGKGDKKNNEGISKDEIVAYLNDKNMSEDEGIPILYMYGKMTGSRAWTEVPHLKDGVWVEK